MSRRVIVNHHSAKLVHDYDLVESEKTTKLFRSDNKEWTDPGSLAASMKDTGDGVKIKIGGRKINLDYAELQELHILINATEFPTFKID
jgi:hypothetical protein